MEHRKAKINVVASLISDKVDLAASIVPATKDFDLLTENGQMYIFDVK